MNKCQAFKLLQRLFQKVASLFLALSDAGDTQRGSQLKITIEIKMKESKLIALFWGGPFNISLKLHFLQQVKEAPDRPNFLQEESSHISQKYADPR